MSDNRPVNGAPPDAIPMGNWYIEHPEVDTPEQRTARQAPPGRKRADKPLPPEGHRGKGVLRSVRDLLPKWRLRSTPGKQRPEPLSLHESVDNTLSMLEDFGKNPQAADGFYPVRSNELSPKKLRRNQLPSAVETKLGEKNIHELVAIRSGVRTAYERGVVDRLSRLSRATVHAVAETIDAALKKAWTPLQAALNALGAHAKYMWDAAEKNVDLSPLWEVALRESRSALAACNFRGSDEEPYGMLKDAIAGTMDDFALLTAGLRSLEQARGYYASSPLREIWINALVLDVNKEVGSIMEDMKREPGRWFDRTTLETTKLLAALPESEFKQLSNVKTSFLPPVDRSGEYLGTEELPQDQQDAVLLRAKHVLLGRLIDEELTERSNRPEKKIEEKGKEIEEKEKEEIGQEQKEEEVEEKEKERERDYW